MPIVMTLANQRVCSWVGLDETAENLLAQLSIITMLQQGEVRDNQCFVREANLENPPRHACRIANGYSWTCVANNRQKTAALYLPLDKIDKTKKILLMRHLLWLGLLPELLTGESFLLHGALVEYAGKGILFCGVSGIGKSTICELLPDDFSILGDDCMVITKHGNEYFATPLPTWSIWTQNKKKRNFDCNSSIAIKKIFLLGRDKSSIEPASKIQSTALFIPSVTDMVNWHTKNWNSQLKTELMQKSFHSGLELINNIIPQNLYFVKKSLPERIIDELKFNL